MKWIVPSGCLVMAAIFLIFIIITLIKPAIGNVFSGIVMQDCSWSGKAIAWVDENRNKKMDIGESPLENVQFFLDDTLNNHKKVGNAKSNQKGEADIFIFIAGCPDTEFEVYPEVPQGYCLTTDSRLYGGKRVFEKNGSGSSDNLQPFLFGFYRCDNND